MRSEQKSVAISSTSVFDNPIATVNAATAQTMCYSCGKLGHYSTNCTRKKSKPFDDQHSSKQEIYGTFKTQMGHQKHNKS